jgi:hypothetical protein
VLPASVSSSDTAIDSSKSLAYESFPFINWESITSNKKDLEQDALNLCNKKTEEYLKEKNLEEKLQVLLGEKEACKLACRSFGKSWSYLRPGCCSPPARCSKQWHRCIS